MFWIQVLTHSDKTRPMTDPSVGVYLKGPEPRSFLCKLTFSQLVTSLRQDMILDLPSFKDHAHQRRLLLAPQPKASTHSES